MWKCKVTSCQSQVPLTFTSSWSRRALHVGAWPTAEHFMHQRTSTKITGTRVFFQKMVPKQWPRSFTSSVKGHSDTTLGLPEIFNLTFSLRIAKMFYLCHVVLEVLKWCLRNPVEYLIQQIQASDWLANPEKYSWNYISINSAKDTSMLCLYVSPDPTTDLSNAWVGTLDIPSRKVQPAASVGGDGGTVLLHGAPTFAATPATLELLVRP